MKTKILTLVLLCWSAFLSAQFQDASFMANGYTLPYRVMFPNNYNPSQRYPLIVFLHGAGERGNDNEAQLTHGKDFLINNASSNYPAIVIAPQCPLETYWSNQKSNRIGDKRELDFEFSDTPTYPMKTLMYLIEDWLSSGKVDVSRVYVGGLSMGGMATFELLWRMPQTFAAAFPICGGGDVRKPWRYAKNTAVWIFHGENDPTVPVRYSVDMYNALKAANCDVKYTGYPNVGHNSWDNVFQESALFPWLFSHSR